MKYDLTDVGYCDPMLMSYATPRYPRGAGIDAVNRLLAGSSSGRIWFWHTPWLTTYMYDFDRMRRDVVAGYRTTELRA
jgi:hypothetical protein